MTVLADLARLPLKCLTCELPHKLDHVVTDGEPVPRPKELHPAFYGCFDWHSAVHGHWMLARLGRTELFDETLTPANIAVEVAYLRERPHFERTYGWAWALTLASDDFLSPALVEAHLMQRVLAPERFTQWLAAFLPRGSPLAPAIVTDRSDPKLAHLDGLNLSRAWCLRALGLLSETPVGATRNAWPVSVSVRMPRYASCTKPLIA